MRRCLRDPMFSRFDTIPECDRQTDTQTHRHTDTRRRHIPRLARRRAVKILLISTSHSYADSPQVYMHHTRVVNSGVTGPKLTKRLPRFDGSLLLLMHPSALRHSNPFQKYVNATNEVREGQFSPIWYQNW